MTSPPAYLQTPHSEPVYGVLRRHAGYYYIEDADPVVLEMAKRVFPGCDYGSRHSRKVRFKITRRAVGELNWLMLRYPLRIENPQRYAEELQQAVEHALRRDCQDNLPPTAPPESFDGTLKPFQASGVSYLLANRRTLLADDMGLGKTVQAIAALVTADAFPAIVVVPPTVRLQWGRQLEVFLKRPGLLYHILDGLKPYPLPMCPIYIVHYGLLRGWADELVALQPKAVVFDEIQELRHTGTKKYSVASLLSRDVEYAWGLSGTPIYNYGGEIWSVLNIVDYHCLGDWESFSREWCIGYGEKVVEKPDVLATHLKREGLCLRRRKSEVQNQLPPKRRIVHEIDYDSDKYSALIVEAQKLAAAYAGVTDWAEKGQIARQIDGVSRLATGVSKAVYVGQFVNSLIAAGERPLVYAWHHAAHAAIVQVLQPKPVQITGRQSQVEKDNAVRDFREGRAPCVLLSLRSTAGLDGLQERATCVVFAELDWSPAVHSQCEDRLHRMGLEGRDLESILCYYLVSRSGYDGVVLDTLGLKIGQFTGLMEDQAPSTQDTDLAEVAGQKHLERVISLLRQQA